MTDLTTRGAGAEPTDDVVELILADHRLFEELLRGLRNRDADRPRLVAELADVLVAHAEAEEQDVYPHLERRAPEDADEIEHGVEEHADGHLALLELLRADVEDQDGFESALEALVETVNHHLDEEEREVLNAARDVVPDTRRQELGRTFRQRRAELLAGRPGQPGRVQELVDRARREGRLD